MSIAHPRVVRAITSAGAVSLGFLLVFSALGIPINAGMASIYRWMPWLTIVMFFLGVAAGMVNVYRAVTGVKTAVGYRTLGAPDAGKRRADDKWDDEE